MQNGKNLGQLVGLSIMALMLLALIAGQIATSRLPATGISTTNVSGAAAEIDARQRAGLD